MKTAALSSSIYALIAATLLTTPGTTTLFAQAAAPAAPAVTPAAAPPVVKIDPAPVQTKPGFFTSFAPIVEKVSPSVVTISTSKNVKNVMRNNPLFNDPNFRRFFGIPEDGDDNDQQVPQAPQRRGGRNSKPPGGNAPGGNDGAQGGGNLRKQALGLGSGVIVSADGHILTNNHVVEGADEIEVTIGNSEHKYKATKVGTDPSTDVAVLKIEAKNLPAITFGDSDKIRVGDIAVAVGNPFGLTQSVSMGVISAVGRGGMGIVDYENFIQTDASINPGNSGGALVDIEGRLIGVNTAIFSRTGGNQGIGFAVPANLAHSVMDSLIKSGRVTRGYLGTNIQPLTEELATAFNIKDQAGALVSGVEANTPAGKAGVKSGDVIVEVAGKKVEGPRELRLLISGMAPGTKIDVKIVREGKEMVVPIELGELPAEKGAVVPEKLKDSAPDVLDGVTVADIDDAQRKEFEIPEGTQGVLITEVQPDSLSATAGIKRGDVVLEINRKPVTNAKQAIELSEQVKNEKKVLVRVSTKGQSRYVVVGPRE
ncbi:MAG: protease [Chthoniobacteraceae bacterium]|nr:protease [Chthoniobacteraceae bacterium]